MTRILALLALLWTLSGQDAVSAAEVPAVAAAADLAFALPEVAEAFRKETGREVKLAFGSSGNFARQIESGAPFEIFLSADESYVERLRKSAKALDSGSLYALGRIVLFVPRGSPIRADSDFADLARALEDNRLKKLAIANPEHAPYGRAAREALQAAGLWEKARDRLVLGENASQAAQFVASGSAQAGIIPLSLALAPAVQGRGTHAVIPERLHRPLRQRMVLLQGAGDTAKAFYQFLQTPGARAIFENYGFVMPVDR